MCACTPLLPPQNSFLIATKTISADVFVFDYSKHPSKPAAGLAACGVRWGRAVAVRWHRWATVVIFKQ